MNVTIISENEDIYIDGVKDAIDYILNVIDVDSDYLYQEKEVIKFFFQNEIYKDISIKDIKELLQQQKNISNEIK